MKKRVGNTIRMQTVLAGRKDKKKKSNQCFSVKVVKMTFVGLLTWTRMLAANLVIYDNS